MTIREELLKIGYSKEYVDELAEKEFKNRLPEKKKISDTKVYKALTTDYVDLLIRRLAWKMYQREERKRCEAKIEQIREQGFIGDKNNSLDVLKYEQSLNNSPIKTEEYQEEDCTVFVHTYEDGLQATVRTHLSGIELPTQEETDIYEKRLLADYLGIDEQEMLNKDDEQINKLVKTRFKKNKNTI